MKKKRSIGPRLLLIGAALLVAFEVVGRIAGAPVLPPPSEFIDAQEWRYADWIEEDSELLWRYRPSQVIEGNFIKPGRYTINSHGYRGPEFNPEKQTGVTRIVCLGESNTFGLGVSDDAVWPRQMEKKLNTLDPQKRQWEVLNLAVTNYSTFQGVRQAREALPSLKPDIVMFCYSWADHQPAADGIPDERIDVGASWQVGAINRLNRSAAWRWLKVAWSEIVPSDPPQQAMPGFDQRRVPSTEYSENLERITREALAVGARPITVTSPISWPPPGMTDTSGVFHVHHRYRRLARFGAIAGGGEFVELANAFDESPRLYDNPRQEIELFNAQGHAFAGELLARYILGDSVVVARYGSQMYTDGR
jgi:lysophospholipase L1-like esterase